MNTFDDYRTQNLKDRMAGRWFTTKRTRNKIILETLCRSIALSLRVLLRKDIGVESFSFWMIIWSFLWIRLCLVINAFEAESNDLFYNFVNPFIFSSFSTGFLNVFSFFFLSSVLWFYFRTEFPMNTTPMPDVLSRGESVPLQPVIKKDNWFFRRKAFVQTTIASVLCLIFGAILIQFEQTIGVGLYFLTSSVILFIDEFNYHRADIRYTRIIKSKLLRAKRKQAEQNFNDFNEYS